MTEDIASTVLDAEKARCAAMLSNDAVALDAVLDPRLVFAHASGAIDDKAEFLSKMAAGRIDYAGIAWDSPSVIVLGSQAAVLTGRMDTHVYVEGEEKHLNNRVTSVWAADEGNWRMVVFQSTPIRG